MTVPAALDGLRLLDLSSRYSHYTGKLFADMGADVVLVEKLCTVWYLMACISGPMENRISRKRAHPAALS